MARRALAASFVLGSLAVVVGQGALTQGCTQDFSTFDASGGGDPGPSSSSPSSSSTGGPSSTSSQSSTSTSTSTGEGGQGGGTTVTSGGGGGSDQGGAGGGCTTPAECDDGNVCTDDDCVAGSCAHVPVGDGPVGGTDDPEDCRNHECNDGVETDVADDTEDPADANPPCELTICAGGAPTSDFANPGTVCGDAPQECDGAGICVGCDPAPPDNECGADTLCSQPSCVDPGVCEPGFLDASENLTDTIDGDCQKPECPGNNVNPVNVADNGDEPADLPCATGSCSAGSPTFTRLLAGVSCIGQTGVCDGAGNLAANCKTCRDTAGGAGTDAGCSGGAPICVEGDAGGLGVCHECLDTGSGSNDDLGCASADVCDATAGGGVGRCVGCYGGGTPVNCAAGQVCRDADETCADCADTAMGSADAGCANASFPACDESGSAGVGTCKECQDDPDCATRPEGHLCNQNSSSECGCSGGNDAASCVGSPRGTRCQSSTACGCNGGANSNDCDHAGSAGPNCNSGVCGP